MTLPLSPYTGTSVVTVQMVGRMQEAHRSKPSIAQQEKRQGKQEVGRNDSRQQHEERHDAERDHRHVGSTLGFVIRSHPGCEAPMARAMTVKSWLIPW